MSFTESQLPMTQVEDTVAKECYVTLQEDYNDLKRKYEALLGKEMGNLDKICNLEKKVKELEKSESSSEGNNEEQIDAIASLVSEKVCEELSKQLLANDAAEKKRHSLVLGNIQKYAGRAELNMTKVGTEIKEFIAGPAGASFKIPKGPTCKDVTLMKTDLEKMINSSKEEVKASLGVQKLELIGEFKKFASQAGGQVCGVCDEYGHTGKDCKKLDKKAWCRECGDDFHVTRNCKKNKVCTRCRAANHNVELHSVEDTKKRMILLSEFGEAFEHFFKESGNDKGGKNKGGNSEGGKDKRKNDDGKEKKASNSDKERKFWKR